MSVSYFNTNEYELMNKDNIVATVSCTRDEFNDLYFEIHHIFSQLPIGFKTFKDWIENRRAPSNRQHIEKLLKHCNCYDLEGFIQVTHAATLNDTFWVRPAESSLSWNNVSLFQNPFDDIVARIAFEGGMYGEHFSTASPEFSTDGTFAKCWTRLNNQIFLMKRGSEGGVNAGLEPYSEMSANRVMRNISRFIEEKLGLKVNMTKSKVDRPSGLKYLGFGFYFDSRAHQFKAKPHAKSVAKFKKRMKGLTCRGWGVSNSYKVEKLNQLIRGWINYFKIGSMKILCAKLDANIRYRLRMCIWKHWKTPQNRAKNLMKLGIDRITAYKVGYCSRAYAHVCSCGAVNIAITNKRLASFGLISMLDYYTERCVTC